MRTLIIAAMIAFLCIIAAYNRGELVVYSGQNAGIAVGGELTHIGVGFTPEFGFFYCWNEDCSE